MLNLIKNNIAKFRNNFKAAYDRRDKKSGFFQESLSISLNLITMMLVISVIIVSAVSLVVWPWSFVIFMIFAPIARVLYAGIRGV